jgi:integrase
MRSNLFIELIGDNPVDTYTGADLQAYVYLLTHWPAYVRDRPKDKTAREILAANLDLRAKPLKRKAMEDGYVSIVKTLVRLKMTEYDFPDPFAGVKLFYPDTAAPPESAEPLGSDQISRIFRTGVASGLMDDAMLPLLGHLTGRRLGLLVHLTGNDVREKYTGVWVAQTSGIQLDQEGRWRRVPIKTDASTTFFVLHDFLREIGFVEWAQGQGGNFLFPQLTGLADPSKSASSYMARLFKKAGVKERRKEVFHSLRGGNIDQMRDNKVDPRDRKLQAGHHLTDEHDLYGFKAISEVRARDIARSDLMEDVDFSAFQGLDFDSLWQARRTFGRRPK